MFFVFYLKVYTFTMLHFFCSLFCFLEFFDLSLNIIALFSFLNLVHVFDLYYFLTHLLLFYSL